MFKAGLRSPKVSGKFEIRRLFKKANSVKFFLSGENYPKNALEQTKKKPEIEFDLGLALIGLRTTWPRARGKIR